jgi:hypothetical protein
LEPLPPLCLSPHDAQASCVCLSAAEAPCAAAAPFSEADALTWAAAQRPPPPDPGRRPAHQFPAQHAPEGRPRASLLLATRALSSAAALSGLAGSAGCALSLSLEPCFSNSSSSAAPGAACGTGEALLEALHTCATERRGAALECLLLPSAPDPTPSAESNSSAFLLWRATGGGVFLLGFPRLARRSSSLAAAAAAARQTTAARRRRRRPCRRPCRAPRKRRTERCGD